MVEYCVMANYFAAIVLWTGQPFFKDLECQGSFVDSYHFLRDGSSRCTQQVIGTYSPPRDSRHLPFAPVRSALC